MSGTRTTLALMSAILTTSCASAKDEPGGLPALPLAGSQAPVDLALVDAFPEIQFDRPLTMRQPPGERDMFYIAEQGGKIVRARAGGSAAQLVLDLNTAARQFASSTQFSLNRPRAETATGLLGMDFSPSWQADHAVYLFYTGLSATSPTGLASKVARIQSYDGGAHFTPPSAPVLTLDLSSLENLGGQTLFGPDGQLYVGVGDAAPDDAPGHRAQDSHSLFGKVVRIAIGAGPAVHALGFRNPWRFSFDRATGALWVADVGVARYEEVNQVVPGGNYGWDTCEGGHRYDPANPDDPSPATCNQPGTVPPVLEYTHAEFGGGAAIIGGYVYRGSAIPGLVGHYVFGDFVHGTIWRLIIDATGVPAKQVILQTSPNVLASFSEGSDGELYVLQIDGRILKIVSR